MCLVILGILAINVDVGILWYNPLYVIIATIALSELTMAYYVIFKRQSFIADVPKGNLALKMIFIFMLLISPFNWLVFLASLVRLRISLPDWKLWNAEEQERKELERQHQQEEHEAQAERDRIAAEERQNEIIEKSKVSESNLPEYSTHPVIGEEAYLETMEACSVTNAVQSRDRSQREIEEISEKLRTLQSRLNVCRADRARHEEVVEKYRAQSNVDEIKREFHSLLALPPVLAVRIVNDQMRLVVRCQTEYEGEKYDMGDWYVWVDLDSNYPLQTRLIRDCRVPGTNLYDPPHINPDKTFCFGKNEDELHNLIERGQVFAAITVAVKYMSETSNRPQIPKVFKKITT